MITVHIGSNSIRVTGHAGGKPRGENIVCAAVSALTQNLAETLENVAGVDIDTSITSGDGFIWWRKHNLISKALVDTWAGDIEGIKNAYGEIELIQAP